MPTPQRQPTVFEIALAVKKGEKKIAEIRPGIRPRISRMVSEMSEDDLALYAAPKVSTPTGFPQSHRLRNASE